MLLAEVRMNAFSKRLQHLREKKGWTPQELATRAQVPYMTIWRLERGEHDYPRVDIAKKLARTFGVSLDVLLGLYEDDENEQNPAARAPRGGQRKRAGAAR
jgi:transcriptional regulator with XRE-family HTH domain